MSHEGMSHEGMSHDAMAPQEALTGAGTNETPHAARAHRAPAPSHHGTHDHCALMAGCASATLAETVVTTAPTLMAVSQPRIDLAPDALDSRAIAPEPPPPR